MNIEITPAAEQYIANLLKSERKKNSAIQLRIEALDADTPYAECGVRFFVPGPEHMEDVIIGFKGFQLFVDKRSTTYLEGTRIDIQKDGLNQALVMDTPNLQSLSLVDEHSPLAERVQALIDQQINPQLAGHGGMVQLVDLTDANEVILRFGGGCHGCGMVDVTLKEGILETFKTMLPEITAVKDVTDHAIGENPYYSEGSR